MDMPANPLPADSRWASDKISPSSRRAFLQRLAALGVAGLGLSGFLAACGGGEEPVDELEGEMGPETEGDVSEAVAECDDYTGLSEQELQKREALEYVAESPNPNQVCSNCRFYTQPEGEDVCGGCQLFAGPVNPGGYCTSWAEMPS